MVIVMTAFTINHALLKKVNLHFTSLFNDVSILKRIDHLE